MDSPYVDDTVIEEILVEEYRSRFGQDPDRKAAGCDELIFGLDYLHPGKLLQIGRDFEQRQARLDLLVAAYGEENRVQLAKLLDA